MSAGRFEAVAMHRLLLVLILVASFVLRLNIVRSGGEYYWPDEISYEDAQKIVRAIAAGDSRLVVEHLDATGPVLFKIVALLPATVEYVRGDDPAVPGLFFSLFSILSIWMIGRIATALGATRREAVLASALLALSTPFFYFARHLLPYDMAMALALTAIDVGIRSGGSVRGSFLAGMLAGCAVFTYFGYFTIAAAALLITVADAGSRRDAARRALASAAGLCLVSGVVSGTSAMLGGRLLRTLPAYAAAVRQGDFDEGWRLPFEYLWHAEHGVLLLWLGGVAFCVVSIRRSIASRRVRAAMTGLAVVMISLAVSSSILHLFVVYGRLVRQLVPFFALIAAYALDRIWSAGSWVRTLAPAALTLAALQAAFNFSRPLTQTFPDDLERQFGPSHTSSLIWVNVEHIYPEPRKVVLPERYRVVYSAPHPLEFMPYQYEGYTLAERRVLRATDLRMRVLAEEP